MQNDTQKWTLFGIVSVIIFLSAMFVAMFQSIDATGPTPTAQALAVGLP